MTRSVLFDTVKQMKYQFPRGKEEHQICADYTAQSLLIHKSLQDIAVSEYYYVLIF